MKTINEKNSNCVELTRDELFSISGGEVTAKDVGHAIGFFVGTIVGAIFAAGRIIVD
jgi:lactobin A/cerein 7B family class IIb bacteriocin